ncbi:SDR family oxidoreductase [Nonomuraea gerenzanensis]|uniref:Oxidoreductase n=1 Tax=Nonomuraea gerenzanensis TaxID=93944 RepID=A0A1M4DX08_9ACTN|nr:SDR family oxidoreductase [Nonomuraea gerenzanensis]UBU13410.1 SDR family oxidoreductase [Nonomuraea gerenzanensis]SBO91071.1 Oxidoreductase [Nonomuraea gerenzanensis]
MTILITGATGTVSRAVLRSLAGTEDVRVLVRDPAKAPAGVQVAVGDLDEPGTLGEAFRGVRTLWLLTAMGPQAPHRSMNAVWAARQAGVEHVVRMSAIGAAHDAPTRNGRLHALSDVELTASGLGWTILRPAFFMQNLLGSVDGDTLYGALGEGRIGMVDVRDIGDFAAEVLRAPGRHRGATYTLTGPASISLGTVAEELSQLYGTPITYRPVPVEAGVRSMLEAGLPEWDAKVTGEYLTAYSRGWGDFTTQDFEKVVGRPATPFARFARDHAEQLRPTTR